MQGAPTIRHFSVAASTRIDPQAGVIYGVSLLTEGPALGHNVFIDAVTLAQVLAAAQNYSGGLKVKMDHGGGAGDIVGFIDNLRIAGPKLLGDFHLLQTSEHRGYVLEIAAKIPDTFGLSIAFSGTATAGEDKRMMQRCTEIYSVDLVSEPAANPDGLFSRKHLSDKSSFATTTNMSEPTIPAASVSPQDEMLASIAARLAKLEAFAFPPVQGEPKAKDGAPSMPMSAKADDAVLLALKEFAAKFGTAPAPVSIVAPVAPAVPVAKTFEQLVAEKRVELKGDNAAAITATIKSNPTEYAAYRAQFGQGVIIKL
jgi:hypothetical protein